MFNSALELARYIVTKCTNDGCPISNLQLQKILYFIQRESLKHGEPAFLDRIEAWPLGPVVPSVYNKFCGSGAMPIVMRYQTELTESTDCVDAIVETRRSQDPWAMGDG